MEDEFSYIGKRLFLEEIDRLEDALCRLDATPEERRFLTAFACYIDWECAIELAVGWARQKETK